MSDEPAATPAGHGEDRPRHQQPIAADVANRVRQIVSSAERVAAEIQSAADERAQRQSADVRAEAEADAARIRRDAEATVQSWLDESRERIDALTRQRIARMDHLTQDLIAHCEAIQVRFAAATTIRTQVQEVLVALGNAAEQLSREAGDAASVQRLSEVPRTSPVDRALRGTGHL